MPDLLFCGPTYTMVANQIYAIPNVPCSIICTDTSPGIQASADPAFSSNQNLTLASGVSGVAGFIRVTTGSPKIMLVRGR